MPSPNPIPPIGAFLKLLNRTVCLLVLPLPCLALNPPVSLNTQGQLRYQADAFGNTVPDFSLAGYRNGGVPLPVAPVLETLSPSSTSDDDSARIQTALDKVASAPSQKEDGVKGAVLLLKGNYRCAATLRLPAGVTLRGEGQDTGGTIITATRIPKDETEKPALLCMQGEKRPLGAGAQHPVLDESVPLGAKSLRVAGAVGLAVGDDILLTRKPNALWIHELKMDQIQKLTAGGHQWKPNDYIQSWQARILSIQGDTLVLDTPVICALEKVYDTSFVQKLGTDKRGRAAAVESLRLVSVYAEGKENQDEAHAWSAIEIHGMVDCWVKEVTALHFAYSCVHVFEGAARITVQDCAMLDPVSKITGGRRYSFYGGGQYVLFQRCYARNGRHDFVNGHGEAGPTVFLDCLAEQTHADIGPHHRWASGQLYDNVKGGEINVQDRGPMGTGHGWAGNCQVFWNCEATSMLCQKAWIPSAQNWALGCIAAKGKPAQTERPDGLSDGWVKHLLPRSLYLTQLSERLALGRQDVQKSIEQVTSPEQRRNSIWEHLQKRYARDR